MMIYLVVLVVSVVVGMSIALANMAINDRRVVEGRLWTVRKDLWTAKATLDSAQADLTVAQNVLKETEAQLQRALGELDVANARLQKRRLPRQQS
jgi:hypothetical protein